MARRSSAGRRYAEAAFEIALRDGTVDAWRTELEAAAAVLGDGTVARVLSNPAIPLEARAEVVTDTLAPAQVGSVSDVGALVERARRLLGTETMPMSSRVELVIGAIGTSVSRPVLNLILLLLRRGRIEDLPRVAAEFRRLDHERKGITTATVISALPLEADEVRALTTRLEQSTGGHVELDVKVDPSLLGGLVVRVGDRMIDGSVRGRLERLRNRLVSGAL
jgi:F-type H+-transporting ATPase subunit delta